VSGGLRFTVLGSGTAKPDPARGPTGFLLQAHGASVLIDGGSGTLHRLARVGVDAVELDAGVYSHRHVDHSGDFVPLLFAMCVPPKRTRPYPVFAGEGFDAFHLGLREVYGKWIRPPGGVPLTTLPLDGPGLALLPGGVTLRTLPANHSAGALHLRFELGPHAIVFSGDTGPSDNLVELAAGADLLVCECAGSDAEPIGGHLTPSAVRDLVAEAQPEEVWLTHFYPHVDVHAAVERVAEAGVPVRRAADGDVWAVG